MSRAKRGFTRRRAVKKIRDRAEGFFIGRRTEFRRAAEAVDRALQYAYVGRKNRKRDFRRLWIARLSAAANLNSTSYSQLMGAMNKAEVKLNRKVLSDIAIHDPKGFAAIVNQVQI